VLTFFNCCDRFFSIDERLSCYCGFPKCRGVVNDTEAEERAATVYAPRSELVDWKGEWGKQHLSCCLSSLVNIELQSTTLVGMDCRGTSLYCHKIWSSEWNFLRLCSSLFVRSQTLRKLAGYCYFGQCVGGGWVFSVVCFFYDYSVQNLIYMFLSFAINSLVMISCEVFLLALEILFG
jgi:hypothetical protein